MLTNNKKILAGIVSLLLLFIFLLPTVIFAASGSNDGTGLVTCGNTPITNSDGQTIGLLNPCDFNDFVAMINRIINWIISIAGVIFTISLIYGGFLYMTSQGDSSKISEARKILWNTLIGFVIILVAWLIVYTILVNLVPDNSSIFRFIGH